jgi:cyclopropane fatty-acyl-phospholipid synthase-like methyltransferase
LSQTTTSSTWYTDFFTELPNEFWRRAVPADAAAQEIDYVQRELGLAPGSRVLDAPCGSGRHVLELAARGHRVTGVDISAEAVAHARRAADAAGLEVELRRADVREVPHDGSFDAALCLGNSAGYLDTAGTREQFAALAAAVRPGGGLVLDYAAVAESFLPGFDGASRTLRAGDVVMETVFEYDAARSRALSHSRFTRGTEVVEATAVHHVRTSGQVVELLVEAGFVDVRLHAGPDGEPYRLGSGRLLLSARRSAAPASPPQPAGSSTA